MKIPHLFQAKIKNQVVPVVKDSGITIHGIMTEACARKITGEQEARGFLFYPSHFALKDITQIQETNMGSF